MLEAVLNPNIRTILVKGPPGSGKTLLACELARNASQAVYVSVTASNRDVVTYNPILKEMHSKHRIIQLNYGGEKDSKIDNPAFTTLDALLESVEESAKKLPDSLIVFDSWDAFLLENARRTSSQAKYASLDRTRIQRALLDISERHRSKLLFLSEESSLVTEDCLFDAIVLLSTQVVSGRRLRHAELAKLSGSPIPQNRYLFSLNEGRFTSFPAPRVPLPRNRFGYRFFIPRKHTDVSFSTGSPDLDSFFTEGIKMGSSVMIEYGRHFSSELALPLFSSITCNFLANGGCSAVIPTSDIVPESITESISPYLPPSVVESFLRVGCHEIREHTSLFPLDPSSILKTREMFWEQVDGMKGAEKRPCLSFVGLDTLEALYGSDQLQRFAFMTIQKVKFAGDLVIFVAKHGMKNKEIVSSSCDIHLRMEEIDRSTILYSIKPKSDLNHLDYDYSSGYPQVRLVPII